MTNEEIFSIYKECENIATCSANLTLKFGRAIEQASRRAALEEADAKAAQRTPLGWVWERRYSTGGYTRKFCTSEFEARELAKDGAALPTPDLVYPFYADPQPANGDYHE
jgi:hypothetical protein